MKGVIMALGVLLGVGIGYYNFAKYKPAIWKAVVVLIMTISLFMIFLPHMAAGFAELKYLTGRGDTAPKPVLIEMERFAEGPSGMIIDREKNISISLSGQEYLKIKGLDRIIAELQYNADKNIFEYRKMITASPLLTIPYVPGLGERIRIIHLHVPVAWVAVLAYLMSMIYSIMYLKTRKSYFDTVAESAAILGFVYTILATVTGSVWAKFNWGSFWNWDPRETSIFILLLIYSAYFTLRASVNSSEQKARLGAVYSILAFVTVPFLVFVLPRITSGLHPGSADEGNLGPVLSSQEGMLNMYKQITLSVSMAAASLVYFWLLNITIRYKLLKNKLVPGE